MSYLVLARKWRPTTFDEVVGQEHVTRTLKNAIERNRVAHALLFTGSRGVGKTSCARILAKALNCEKGPTTEPCGVCQWCTDITQGSSVDVFEIDGASNNSVEQIREIRESVKFISTRGKRKMYIIDEVHMLSTAAFNALLKTLEEPPEHVLFVFATTEPHKIPDTILSRCQRYDFKRIPERKIVEALLKIVSAEGIQVEELALHHIAREAKGGMRDSLSMLDQVIAFCGDQITEARTREVLGIADRAVLYGLVQSLLDGQAQRALEIIDDFFELGLDLQKFTAELVKHMRDLMVIRTVQHAERLVDLPESEIELLAQQVSAVAPAQLHRLFSAVLKGAEEVSVSSFPKFSLEMLILRLCQQGSTLPLAEVLQGLARLEARLDDPSLPPELPPTGGPAPQGVPSGAASSGDASGHGGLPSPAPRAQATPQPVAVAQPATPQPVAVVQPVAPQPVPVVQPAAPQPVAVVQPAAPQPAVSRPAATQPAANKPTASKTATAQPAASKPAQPTGIGPQRQLRSVPWVPPSEMGLDPQSVAARIAEAEGRPVPQPQRRSAGHASQREDTPQTTEDAPQPPEHTAPAEAPQSIEVTPQPVEVTPQPVEVAPQPVEVITQSAEVTPQPVEVAPQPAEVAPQPVEVVTQSAEVTPPTGAPLPSSEDALRTPAGLRFAELLTALGEHSPFLAKNLEHELRLLSFEGAHLAALVPPSQASLIPQAQAAFEVLAPTLGQPLTVDLQLAQPDDPRLQQQTLFSLREQQREEHRQFLRESARQHPLVQSFVRTFDAQIIDIVVA